jgi:hypothetical protein
MKVMNKIVPHSRAEQKRDKNKMHLQTKEALLISMSHLSLEFFGYSG